MSEMNTVAPTIDDLAAEFANVQERFLRFCRPEPVLLVSEWADAHRILPSKGSAEPGPWRTSRTPYLKAILDALSTGSPYHTVVFAKGAQIGATEAGSNWLGYCIHHAPAPMLMVQPTIDMVKRISKQRVQPMIEVTPVLAERIAPSRARDAGNTLQQKDFAGGTLVMTGANSATGLRSMPARYLFLDEVDAYPGDVEGEGDPIELAIARTATFKRNRKIFMCSTPTIEGESRIWKAFEETDQRYYHVPCPDCHEYQMIDWQRIVWPEGDPESAALTCQHCGVLIDERHKGWMLENGRWTPAAEGMDPGMVGFHLSSLYSPPGWYSWSDAARDFLKAKGHSTKLQSFINTKLGQCWEDRTGEKVDHEALMARREAWDVHAIPADIALITAGVDVQDDRLEITLIGWTGAEQARVLDHLQLWGAPGEAQLWSELDALLLGQFATQDGRLLRIRATALDTGGHHTQRAYEFCRSRASRKVFPIKGRAGNHPVWPSKVTKTKLSQGVRLYLVGVDTAKDQIRSALAVTNPDRPRYVAFAADLPDSYFTQLTSEKRVTIYNKSGVATRAWKKPAGARNEALDCFVYAMAALEALKQSGVRLKIVAQQTGALPTRREEEEPAPVREAMPSAVSARPAIRTTRRQSSAVL
jgi:phage terminase large subunit GpA-like protein